MLGPESKIRKIAAELAIMTIRKVSDSEVITIPKGILRKAGLKRGDKVVLVATNNRITISSVTDLKTGEY